MKLTLIALAWLVGVVLAAAAGPEAAWIVLLATGSGTVIGLAFGGKARQAALVALLAAVVSLLGLLRYETARSPGQPYGVAQLNDGASVQVSGTVVSHPEETGRVQRFTLRADQLIWERGKERTTGSILITTRLFPRFEYGDRVELRGSLITPPSFDDFDYREYLARQGVVSLASFPRLERTGAGGGHWHVRLLADVRRPLSEALTNALPEPEAALARGMLLGQRASIPRDLTDDFNTAGISHLVAISGSNVMLVAGLCLAALSPVSGRRPAVWTSVVLVLLFAALVGTTPSVSRAAVMAIVTLGAIAAGRPGAAVGALVLTAAVLTALDPLLVEDVGFQLSVTATAGIVLWSGRLQDALTPRLTRLLPASMAAFVAATLAMTLSASVFVLPVMANSFGRLSLVALPANLLAVFAFPVILATAALTALLGVLSDDLGFLAGSIAVVPLRYLIEVGRFFAAVPGASLDLRTGGLGVVSLYVVLGLLTRLLLRRPRTVEDDADGGPDARESAKSPRPLRIKPALLASFILVAAGGFSLVSAASDSSGRLVVTILDVGQGDAILIETPRGQRILVDGGPAGDRLMQALGRELPPSVRALDLVVLTHGQDDHVTGLIAVLDRYRVDAVLAGPLPGSTAAYRAWEDALQREQATHLVAVAGEWIDLDEGLRVEVLGPPAELLRGTEDDLNNNSVLLRLVYGDISFLLTGDLAAEGEQELLRGVSGLRSTVLKVGHHGSDGSSTAPFLAAVQPSYAVISAGAENTYGHPSPTTRLRLRGIPYARTDLNGRVRFETDGHHLWADLERGEFQRLPLDGSVAAPAR